MALEEEEGTTRKIRIIKRKKNRITKSFYYIFENMYELTLILYISLKQKSKNNENDKKRTKNYTCINIAIDNNIPN